MTRRYFWYEFTSLQYLLFWIKILILFVIALSFAVRSRSRRAIDVAITLVGLIFVNWVILSEMKVLTIVINLIICFSLTEHQRFALIDRTCFTTLVPRIFIWIIYKIFQNNNTILLSRDRNSAMRLMRIVIMFSFDLLSFVNFSFS